RPSAWSGMVARARAYKTLLGAPPEVGNEAYWWLSDCLVCPLARGLRQPLRPGAECARWRTARRRHGGGDRGGGRWRAGSRARSGGRRGGRAGRRCREHATGARLLGLLRLPQLRLPGLRLSGLSALLSAAALRVRLSTLWLFRILSGAEVRASERRALLAVKIAPADAARRRRLAAAVLRAARLHARPSME